MPDINSTVLIVIDIQRGAFDGERCTPIDRRQILVDQAVSLVIAADGRSTWPSGTASAGAISDRINLELQSSGASLELAANLVRLPREARTWSFARPLESLGRVRPQL